MKRTSSNGQRARLLLPTLTIQVRIPLKSVVLPVECRLITNENKQHIIDKILRSTQLLRLSCTTNQPPSGYTN